MKRNDLERKIYGVICRHDGIKAKEVAKKDRLVLGEAMAEIASKHGMQLYTCLEGADLAPFGVNTGGCMTKEVLEHAIGEELLVPSGLSPARQGCRCLLGSDIGAYNTCLHFCKYCYANYDKESVLRNRKLHDPSSPLLVGHLLDGDQVREANQVRLQDRTADFYIKDPRWVRKEHYDDIEKSGKDHTGYPTGRRKQSREDL